MTVSQDKPILWEPLSAREAVDDTLALMRVDGLEPDEFGMELLERIATGEIDHDQAIALALATYRK